MLRSTLLLFTALCAMSATAFEPVAAGSRIAYADPAQAAAHVRDTCALETSLPKLLEDSAHSALVIDGMATGGTFSGRIIEIADPGETAWSGGKLLLVEGTLGAAGQIVGAVVVRRESAWDLADGCAGA